MQELISGVKENPLAKLFIPQTLLNNYQTNEVVTEENLENECYIDTLKEGVYSRFQLLQQNTALKNMMPLFTKETTLNSSLLIYPDEDIAKICNNIKEYFHKIEELKRRTENAKSKFD